MNTFLVLAFFAVATEPIPLRVTVYDHIGLKAAEKSRMLAEAGRILARAGIQPVWIIGDMAALESRLIEPIVPNGDGQKEACEARTDLALDLVGDVPGFARRDALGLSIPFAARGLNVQLYLGNIAALARETSIDVTVLAGHALAHEAGHVLTRSNDHARTGVMAGPWTEHEYSRMRAGLLTFSREESRRLRATLKRSRCNGPAPVAGLRQVGSDKRK